jgi:hypothetical protein
MENWLKVVLIIIAVIVVAAIVFIVARYMIMKPYYDFLEYQKQLWIKQGDWDAVNSDCKQKYRDMLIALTLNKEEADLLKASAKLHEMTHPEDAGKYTREKDFVDDKSDDESADA